MKKFRLNDLQPFDLAQSSKQYTEEGFLKVRGRVARTGVQKYYGFELGLEDSPFLMYSIYRPESVVFEDSFLKSFNGLDVTNDHPKGGIDASNYKDLTCGVVISDARREEGTNYIVCDLLIKDKGLIMAIEAGKKEISLGYSTTIEMVDGEGANGEKYDGIVTSIPHVNHVAIVNKGRAGGARLLDSLEVNTMKFKVGAVEVELEDAIGTAITAEIEKINATMKDQATQIASLNENKAKSDAEIEDLKAQLADAQSKVLTPEQLSDKIKALADVRAKAQMIAGADFVCDSMDEVEIKRQALAKALPERSFADQAPEYVNAFFDARLDYAKQANDSIKKVADALKSDPKKTEVEDAYTKYKKEVADAWKK